MDNTTALREDCLPQDWYFTYGERLRRAYLDRRWRNLPLDHASRVLVNGRIVLEDNVLNGRTCESLTLSQASRYVNRSAMLYLATGPPPSLARRLNNEIVPHDTEDSFKMAWRAWYKLSDRQDKQDARYSFEPHMFSIADTDKLNKWIGLGKTPQSPDQADVNNLLGWHNALCDAVQRRISAAYVPNNPACRQLSLRHRARRSTEPWWVEPQDSMLAPTFRAVLIIARSPMAPEMPVLLVLTGQNQEMSKPPTFDTIPPEQIVARRSKDMVQVSLFTAIRYLHVLEKTEETANSTFRAKSEERKRVMYQKLVYEANFEVELLRRECGRRRPRMLKYAGHRNKHKDRLSVKLEHARCDMIDAWKEVVADEKVLRALSDTALLRAAMLD